jgi:Fe-S cluster biosynthesis and repair protein YggX
MSNIDERIAQWEKMTAEAPDGMSWFSLANAYRDAQRDAEAAAAYENAIALDPTMSRAYQLLGQTLIKLDRKHEAGPMLTQGYNVAAQRGDVMPQKAIGELLQKIGLPVPKVEIEQPKVEITGDQILDRHTGTPGSKMADPPMRGKLGKFIFEHFSQETWRQWIAQGTKVINELRLDFSRDDHQKVYDEQMMEYLGITKEELESYDPDASNK